MLEALNHQQLRQRDGGSGGRGDNGLISAADPVPALLHVLLPEAAVHPVAGELDQIMDRAEMRIVKCGRETGCLVGLKRTG